jgi:hypothetical protein
MDSGLDVMTDSPESDPDDAAASATPSCGLVTVGGWEACAMAWTCVHMAGKWLQGTIPHEVGTSCNMGL